MKYFIIMLVFTLCGSTCAGQLYIQLGGGYGIDMAAQSLGEKRTENSTAANSKQELSTGSLGRGFTTDAEFGYFTEYNLGFSIGARYLFGANVTFNESANQGGSSQNLSKLVYTGSGLMLIPSLQVRTPGAGINLYLRFGAVFGFMKATALNTTTSSSGDIRENGGELTGGMGLGWSGAGGVLIPVSERFGASFELNSISMSYMPSKGRTTVNRRNGVDEPVSEEQKEFDLVTSYHTDETNKYLAVNLPFSSLTFNLGLRVNL